MHPELQFVADRRLGVFTAAEARRAGYSPEEIRAAVRSTRWRPLRRGVYIESSRWAATAAEPRLRHLIACAAVLVTLRDGPVLSHGSAAWLHGLVLPRRLDDEVRLTDEQQWRTGRGYRVARAGLPAGDVVRTAGFLGTAPARTIVDCAREWPVTDAVVTIDAALHAGLVTPAALESAVRAGRHWVGIGVAGRALSLSDGRAESPLETRGRLALLAAGFPRPELQVEIHDSRGFVARVDAWYDDAAVVIEFDGQVKYLAPAGGRDPGEVLWEEKRREDRLRALGARVLRLSNGDVVSTLREAAPRLRGLLATSPPEVRRFRVVRRPEPGASPTAAA